MAADGVSGKEQMDFFLPPLDDCNGPGAVVAPIVYSPLEIYPANSGAPASHRGLSKLYIGV